MWLPVHLTQRQLPLPQPPRWAQSSSMRVGNPLHCNHTPTCPFAAGLAMHIATCTLQSLCNAHLPKRRQQCGDPTTTRPYSDFSICGLWKSSCPGIPQTLILTLDTSKERSNHVWAPARCTPALFSLEAQPRLADDGLPPLVQPPAVAAFVDGASLGHVPLATLRGHVGRPCLRVPGTKASSPAS